MKTITLVIIMLLAGSLHAQSPSADYEPISCDNVPCSGTTMIPPQVSSSPSYRILAGVSGGSSFDNDYLGVTAGIEVPFLHHYEFDFHDTFAPIEHHVALGHGYSNLARIGGIGWINNRIGVASSVEYSNYAVTQVAKADVYAFVGPIVRFHLFDAPNRLTLSYVREINNGVHGGIETSRLQGFNVNWTARVGCAGAVCFRISEDFSFGHVLEQGNPMCDGSRGPVLYAACARRGAFGGGFTGGVLVEFPRRRGREDDGF